MIEPQPCTRSDHPDRPHFHCGFGDAHWSTTYPHWDIYATSTLYAKGSALIVRHPDMDYEKGWRS